MELFLQLTKKEIKARYKQSILGYAWAVIVPLLNLLVLSLVFSNLFKIPTNGVPYHIFLFTALVPWTFTASALTMATSSILANSSLITKVKIKREVLPLSSIASKLIDLCLSFFVLAIFLYFSNISPSWMLLFLPIIFIIQLIFTVGISFFLSATNVYFRDIEQALGVFLMIWMYLTPIVYSPSQIPSHLAWIFQLNPFTGIINSYRNIILYKSPPDLLIIYSFLVSCVIFVLGVIYFKKVSKFFADVI